MRDQGSSGSSKADWYADPLGRHQFRYWDGLAWTDSVADDGQQATDPVSQVPRQPSAPVEVSWRDVKAMKARGDVNGLVKVLRSENKLAQADAFRALGDLGDQRAVPALLELTADDTESLRVLAAYALAKLGDPRAVPVLLGALDHRPDTNTVWAVRGVGHLRSAEAVIPLVRLLRQLRIVSMFEVNLWLDVVDALQAIGDPRAVDGLLNWRSNPSINTQAVWRLGVTEKLAARVEHALAACGRQDVPTLVSSLLEKPNEETALALMKLGWTPQSDEERLAYAVAREEWEEAGEIGTIALQPLLIELERSGNSGAFSHGEMVGIARGLGATGDVCAVEPLVRILFPGPKDHWRDETNVLCSAARSLTRIGEPGIEPLVTMVGGNKLASCGVKEAADALALCGPRGLEALGSALQNHSEAHRRHQELIADGSSHYDDPDNTGWLKWNAVRHALVDCAGKEALPMLEAMLDDENESVRTDAADLIAKIAKREPN